MQAVRAKKGAPALAAKEKEEFNRIIERYKRTMSILDTDEFALVAEILSTLGHDSFFVDHASDALKVNVYQYKVKSYLSNDESIVRVKNAFESIVEGMAPDRKKETISAESAYVCWVYEWDFEFKVGEEIKTVPLKVDITAYIDNNSDQCRRVQTGTKEVPIYRYDCSAPAEVVPLDQLPPPVILID